MRLFIIDDDFQTVEVVRDRVNWKAFGFDDVQTAYNVASAKKLFEEKTPDLAICDIEMPKGTGLDLLKWVRDSGYKTEFIFFTCHESFEYATTAMQYDIVGYVIKPFHIHKIEMAVEKAVKKIQKETQLAAYKQFGEYWLENRKIVTESFWRELLFAQIEAQPHLLRMEAENRKLSLDPRDTYQLMLVSILKSQSNNSGMEASLFKYTLKKICAEVILDELDFDHTIYYGDGAKHLVLVVIKTGEEQKALEERGRRLIEAINRFLKCGAAGYISRLGTMDKLPFYKLELETQDHNNIMARNQMFLQEDLHAAVNIGEKMLDFEDLTEHLQEGNPLIIANRAKEMLELLSANGVLNADIMHAFHQNFLQVVYAYLYKKGIQAFKLFEDSVSRMLNDQAENSVFDMMKWINTLTQRTIDYVAEVEKTMSIVERAKIFIREHYQEEITKTEVANAVFLTPDYLGKLFKAEAGITIKSFINDCRIKRSKELLASTDMTISQIAGEVGFDNFSYFSTVFKKEVGISPYLYKREQG